LLYVLHDAGFEAEWVANAERALARVGQETFDLILTDLFLPGESGLELCRRLKASPDGHRHLVLMITRSGNPVNLLLALEAGADGFMTKNARPAEIAGRILQALAQRDPATRPQGPDQVVFLGKEYHLRGERPQLLNALMNAFEDIVRLQEQNEQSLRERRQTEEALRVSEERFRLLVEGVKDYAILLLSPTGHVLTWNAGAQQIKGYRAEEIVGQHFSRFYPEDAITRGWPAWELQRAAADGRFEDEGWRLRKDGSRFWANVVLTALRDAAGNLKGFAKVTRDLSERKQAEEKLKAFTRQLQRSNLDLELFASVAAHDLQEPLRKIQAFGDRLQTKCGDALGEQGREYLDRMLTSAQRMRALINDLLTFARLTTKAGPFEPVDLARVAREVVSNLEARIQQTAGRVEVGPLPTVDADPSQMRQLLQNLIGNALKFHRPGEPPVVKVEGELLPEPASPFKGQGRSLCQIRVQDNGIGFEEKYLDRIFEVFQRLHGRHEYEGTGVGLAICRKIAERHGGSITARSAPAQGATVLVTMPSKQANEEKNHDPPGQAHHHPDGR
jgi:PAS domain S-box-containing protein